MKYALISDVHANLPALDAVLNDISSRRDIDAVYHLGDLVGYAPWPNEVVSRIMRDAIPGVAGNYDSTVATDYKHCGCKYEDPRQEELSHLSYAWTRQHVTAETKHEDTRQEELSHISYAWTRENVSPDTKRFLGSLPFRIDIRPLGGHVAGPTLTLLHGNQTLNTVYVTEDRADDFLAKMGSAVGARSGDIVGFGHTHKAWHRVVDGVHFVNTGSVGRPKDGDWRAGYATIEIRAGGEVEVEFPRVEYDVDGAVAAIHASTLPHEFAAYLRAGGHRAEVH